MTYGRRWTQQVSNVPRSSASQEDGPLAFLFAATYPDRVTKLCLYGTFARAAYDSDYEIGVSPEIVEEDLNTLSEEWGTGKGLSMVVQNIPPEAMPIIARYERNATTPKMVAEIMRSNFAIDVRSVLPAISVPTLVLHTQGDPLVPIELGRWLAEHIPSAEFVEFEGAFHGDWNTKGLFPEAASFRRSPERGCGVLTQSTACAYPQVSRDFAAGSIPGTFTSKGPGERE
jgi:pimeloyl-ACP methyl ester carboxylesterase